jgi:enoyl-CoA hydratase/carnithine racemase
LTDLVQTDFSDGIATVTLNRPEKKNALNRDMFDAISAAGEELKTRKDVRAVILTGAGSDFCSGLDTALFMEWAQDFDALRATLRSPPTGERANWFQKPCYVWAELDVPVIAAITGVAFGGGAQLALAADFRIARPDAQFSIMEGKWGIIPDLGITQNLPKLIRADQAKELIMSARILSGTEAAEMGLVTAIAADPLAHAAAMAKELTGRSPEMLKMAKCLVDTAWSQPAGEGLKTEAELQAQIIGGPNQIEAVMAAVQKRAPKFS